MAESLGMDFKIKLNYKSDYSPPKNKMFIREDYKKRYKKEYIDICSNLWYMPVINWNGNMLGCCCQRNEKFAFGNVFKESFFKVYYGKKMSIARELLKKPSIQRKDIYCTFCKNRPSNPRTINNLY